MVVLVAGVAELHNLRIALGLVVDHFLHGAAVIQHSLGTHPLLTANDAGIHICQVFLGQLGRTLRRGAVGIDSLTEATLRQVVGGQLTLMPMNAGSSSWIS